MLTKPMSYNFSTGYCCLKHGLNWNGKKIIILFQPFYGHTFLFSLSAIGVDGIFLSWKCKKYLTLDI